jgi:hypothetical protein
VKLRMETTIRIMEMEVQRLQTQIKVVGLTKNTMLSLRHLSYMVKIGQQYIDILGLVQALKQGLMHRNTSKN